MKGKVLVSRTSDIGPSFSVKCRKICLKKITKIFPFSDIKLKPGPK